MQQDSPCTENNEVRYCCLLLALLPLVNHAQLHTMTWDELLENMQEELGEENSTVTETDDRLLYLEELHLNPFDINSATSEELSALPFLTEDETDQILLYLHRHGRIDSWGELGLIGGLHIESIRALPLFCFIGKEDGTEKKIHETIRQEADARVDVPLYYRRGFTAGSIKGGGRAYAGDPLAQRVRYGIETAYISAKVYARKDAGERFYDYYGGYVEARGLGCVEKIVAGNYKAGYGEGLVVGRASSSKAYVSGRMPTGIMAQGNTTETNMLRGAAAELHYKNWKTAAFVSYKGLDGTLTEDGEVQTIATNGLHRTEAERARKNNVYETVAGGHMQWNGKKEEMSFYVGMTGMWRHTSLPLNPRPKETRPTIYRDIYPKGQDWGVIGLCYGWAGYRWSAAGETATSLHGWGTTERVGYKASKRLELAATGRYYSERFHSEYATAMSENSRRQNELGLLVRLTARPWDMTLVEAYADFFYFHWPRYNMSKSDNGQDIMVQVTAEPAKGHSISMRYNMKRKAANDRMNTSHRLKIQYTYEPHDRLRMQTSITARRLAVNDQAQTRHMGWGAMQSIKTKLLQKRMTGTLSVGYFNTPVYANSIYLYEPSLWNSTSYTQYYGHGMRLSATLRWTGVLSRKKPQNDWMIEIKYGLTHYLDRDTQSSGQQTIFSPTKQDITAQLRLRI